MSTHEPPRSALAAELVPAAVAEPEPVAEPVAAAEPVPAVVSASASASAAASVSAFVSVFPPAPPTSAPSRAVLLPGLSPGVRTVVAALLAALAGAALLGAPTPAVAARPGATSSGATPSGATPSGATPSGATPAGADPAGADPSGGTHSPAREAAPAHFTGRAFDTCDAPSLEVMRAWRSSPYGAVGIYFGGRGRGCPVQRELTPAWVASVNAMGWRLLPLFVGSQAPCVVSPAKRPFAIGGSPWSQGTREGAEAVREARALGIDASSPLYLDIEAYRQGDASCAATTISFVRAWNREVRRLGYLPGFYSSADTGVRDIEEQRRAGTKDLPAVMWFARWRGRPSLYSEEVLDPQAWMPHARIHQYAGNVTESHGGRRLYIDRNAMDAPVARVTPPAP